MPSIKLRRALCYCGLKKNGDSVWFGLVCVTTEMKNSKKKKSKGGGGIETS